MKKLGMVSWVYLIGIIGLFFYSYTQVDLGLTLSRLSIWQTIEKSFQYVGYFQRPLSTLLFLLIVSFLTIFYIVFLKKVKHKTFSEKQFWKFFLLSACILTLSYTAFSYDIFNYMFDARIFTHYGQNPYLHKALDYPHDPMLGFMHWTQRTYPYGAAWLLLTIPISFIGLQYFLLTFFLFKIFIAACAVGALYVIGKIAQIVSPKQKAFILVLFGLNPLFLIESFASPHNDIVMMFFALWGIYLLLQKRWVWALSLIIFSALIKDVTVFLIPPAVGYMFFSLVRKKDMTSNLFFLLSVCSMVIGTGVVLTQKELQPWYFLWTLPFFLFLRESDYLISFLIGLSLGLLLRYTPFLYLGNWDGIAIPIRFWVVIVTPLIFVSFTLLMHTFWARARR